MKLRTFIIIWILLMTGIAGALVRRPLLNMTELDTGNNDLTLYGVNDPNGTPADVKIPFQELMLGYTGSTSVATLGTVTTGTWQATPIEDAYIPNDITISQATAYWIRADESADATLTTLGGMHVRGDEDRYSFHAGTGGEVDGEVTKSMLDTFAVAFDPGKAYDSNSVVPLFKAHAKTFPNGWTIDYWEVDCMLDPNVEMDLDLCYANNWDDVGDPNIIDVLDTTDGLASEDTDANINGGSAIPVGSAIYLSFGADPEGTCNMLTVNLIGHREED